ncbi:MAG: zinc-dependent metalloprotease [Actinomycetota bacterium]
MENIDSAELTRRLLQIPLFREIQNVIASQSGPVDWVAAEQMATAVSKSGIRNPKATRTDAEEFQQAIRISELSVLGHTGLGPVQGVNQVSLQGRGPWATQYLEHLKPLIERLAKRFTEQVAVGGAAGGAGPLLGALGPYIMGLQIGLCVGYLSHKAVGDWDIGLPPKKPGRVVINYPNTLDVQSELDIPAEPLRMWLALRAVTRELHFQSVQWAGPYLNGLVHQYIDAAEIHTSELFHRLQNITDPQELTTLMQQPDELFPMLRSAGQEAVVDRIGAFLSVAEGYGDWIMNKAGAGMVQDYEKIREGMNRRRATRSSAEKMLEKMLGLDLPNEARRRGQRFIAEVAPSGALDTLWAKPEHLPDTVELAQPARWLTRLED